MTTLREAAKAVLDCWDSPKWGWAPASPTADLMAALRAALEQQPAQRKPLTDEQIEELDDKVRQVTIDKGSPVGWFAMQLARAVEQAHGIGKKP